MKVEIAQTNNGFIVTYWDSNPPYGCFTSEYVYKSTEDFWMLEEISKRLLKRKIQVIEK